PCAVRRGRGRGPPMRGARDPIAPVLLDDDGELDEVRRVLVSLGIEYAETRAGAPRARVIVSNGRRRDAELRVSPDAGLRRFHVAVVEKLTRMQRRGPRREPRGLAFLFERPADPPALRLVLLHALSTGPERRRAPRVAMSVAVRVRTGVLARAATLVELSEGGCRLATGRSLGARPRLEIVLPAEAT